MVYKNIYFVTTPKYDVLKNWFWQLLWILDFFLPHLLNGLHKHPLHIREIFKDIKMKKWLEEKNKRNVAENQANILHPEYRKPQKNTLVQN